MLLESKSKFVTAKRAGVNIETAVRALVSAKESLRLGDLGTAVRLAKHAESAVEVTMKAHRSAAKSLSTLSRSLAVAEQMDALAAEDAELLDMMYRANFRSVFIGIETPRLDSLNETKKFQNVRGDSLGAKPHRQPTEMPV